MWRLRDEEGAVAVVTAILITMLIGFTALVIDVARMYHETRQLQNGADAAALAIAQECVAGDCGDVDDTAGLYTDSNANDGATDAEVQLPGLDGENSVTVTASTRTAGGDAFLTHWFAGVLGVPESAFDRSATARWGYIGAAKTIPLTFSICEWNNIMAELDDEAPFPSEYFTIYHHTTDKKVNKCDGPAGQDYPGGFGWLDTDGTSSCTAVVELGEVEGDTGSGSPSPAASTGCTTDFFAKLLGQEVLMPIFTEVKGTGSNAKYIIIGFAAIEVSGYKFGGGPAETSDPAPCSGSDRCIRGRFIEYYDLGSEPTSVGGDFGAFTIGLSR
jgi:hypothetical protein